MVTIATSSEQLTPIQRQWPVAEWVAEMMMVLRPLVLWPLQRPSVAVVVSSTCLSRPALAADYTPPPRHTTLLRHPPYTGHCLSRSICSRRRCYVLPVSHDVMSGYDLPVTVDAGGVRLTWAGPRTWVTVLLLMSGLLSRAFTIPFSQRYRLRLRGR